MYLSRRLFIQMFKVDEHWET